MNWIEIATLMSSVATMIGVFVAGYQIWRASNLNRTQFEDSLSKEYRELMQKIPVKALLGKALTPKEFREARPYLFHYINLTNDQIFLRSKNRVSLTTWIDWQYGMKLALDLPAFRDIWDEVKLGSENFDELRTLERKKYDSDPRGWKKGEKPRRLK